MFRVGVRISKEVGQADCGERIVIAERTFIEFDHFVSDVRLSNRCAEPWMSLGSGRN